MRELIFDRRPAASGDPQSMVVFLHGYGADGADLLGLSEPLAPHMMDTVFVAPDAPERCAANPMGFQWFPIPWLDGSSEEDARIEMYRAFGELSEFLDKLHKEEKITPEKTVIIGFSQGTMMALHVGLRRAPAYAGIVGFSGRLLVPETLGAEMVSKPPVLLLHGDQDDMVPPASLGEAEAALKGVGLSVVAHVMEGTGHGIAPEGLGVALRFMKERLY